MSEPNTVDLTPDVAAAIAGYQYVAEQIKSLEETKANLRADIERALGDNEIGRVNGLVAVTWKRNKKTEKFNKAALAKDHPALVAEYTELVDGNRVFKVGA